MRTPLCIMVQVVQRDKTVTLRLTAIMAMPLVGSWLTLLRARLSPHCMHNILTPTLPIHCPFLEHSAGGALAYMSTASVTIFVFLA